MNIDISQFGFDDSESAVYVALLELGQGTVSQVTKEAGISRTLGYHVLEKLAQKNLVDKGIIKSKQIYTAKHPRQLLTYVQNKERTWKKKSDEMSQLLPYLNGLFDSGIKPTIRHQEGSKGLISLYEEKLYATTDILSVLDVESWQTPEFWTWAQDYHVKRSRKNIHERILLLDTEKGKEWVRNYKGVPKSTTYRWVHAEHVKKLLSFGGAIDTYDDSIMLSILDAPTKVGMIIESKTLANIVRAMFELAWESAEPVVFKK